MDRASGRRCSSKHLQELDHIKPFSHGGENTEENLRVLCSAHNRYAWENRRGR